MHAASRSTVSAPTATRRVATFTDPSCWFVSNSRAYDPDHGAGSGVPGIGRVAAIGLDDHHRCGVATDRAARLAHRAGDDHGHVGRERDRRSGVVAGPAGPVGPAAQRGNGAGKAFEAAWRTAAAGRVEAGPAAAPEGDGGAGGAGGGRLVCNDEAAGREEREAHRGGGRGGGLVERVAPENRGHRAGPQRLGPPPERAGGGPPRPRGGRGGAG